MQVNSGASFSKISAILMTVLLGVTFPLSSQVVVGERTFVYISIDSGTRPASELVETLIVPGAKFVRLRIKSVVLSPGSLLVLEASGQEIQRIEMSGEAFWTQPIPGEAVSVHLVVEGDDNLSFVEIDEYHAPEREFRLPERDICGNNGNLDAICFDGFIEYIRSRPVGRYLYLDSAAGAWAACTGFLITDGNGVTRFLTNNHCANSQSEVDTATVDFNYQRSSCGGTGDDSPLIYSGDEFLVAGSALDFSLFSLTGNPENVVGTLRMDLTSVADGDRLFAVHHPSQTLGGRKMIDDSTGSNGCEATSGGGSDDIFEHTCDTEKGSSGSPLFDWSSTRVIGLHHSGSAVNTCFLDDNDASEMQAIEPLIRSFFANDSAPDLVVHSPSISATLLNPSQSFLGSATVRNQGDASSASTTLRYYYSTNSVISTSDTQIGTDGVIGLGASQTSPEGETLTGPSSPGAYWFGACVDSVSSESSTSNNCSAGVPFTVFDDSAPDLVVQSPSMSVTSLNPSQSFVGSATVRNQGDASSASTTLRYYYSTNSAISTSDTQIGTDGVIGLGASQTSPESETLTGPSSPGAYWFGACVDSVSSESSTSNNCSAGVPFTVIDESAPDLVVQSPSMSVTSLNPSQSFVGSATVRNQGDASSASTTLRYYYSTNSAISTSDTQIGADGVFGLGASQTSPESETLTGPSSPGAYWFGACVDSVSSESSTSNNCSTGVPFTVIDDSAPDLVVQSPSMSVTPLSPSQSFVGSATVRNQGNASSASTTLRYYYSTNSVISTSDSQIGADGVFGLGASQTSPESETLTGPSSPGAYWFGACVDSVSSESSTSNNCSTGVPFTVIDDSAPDLVVQSPSMSHTVLNPSQSFLGSATVSNQGGAASASTTLRYFYSADSVISTSDIQIGADDVLSLGAAQSSFESESLAGPSSPGTYWFGACADGVPGESSGTNNCSASVEFVVDEDGSDCADDLYETFGSGSSDDDCFGSLLNIGVATPHLHCDADWVFFLPIAGATYEIETTNLVGGADTTLGLSISCGGEVAFDDDGGDGFASRIVWTAESDAPIDLEILEFAGSYVDGEAYSVQITCVAGCSEVFSDGFEAGDVGAWSAISP